MSSFFLTMRCLLNDEKFIADYPRLPTLFVGEAAMESEYSRSRLACKLLRSLYGDSLVVISVNEKSGREIVFNLSFCEYLPQFFVGGEFIGGLQIICEFIRSNSFPNVGEKIICKHQLEFPPEGRSKGVWRIKSNVNSHGAIATTASGSIKKLDLSAKKIGETFSISEAWINCVAIDKRDDKLWIGTSNNTTESISLLESGGYQRNWCVRHLRWVNCIEFVSRTNCLIVGDGAGQIKQIAQESGKIIREKGISDSNLWCLAVDQESETVCVGDGNGYIHFINATSLRLIKSTRIDSRCITDVVFCPFLKVYFIVGFEGKLTVTSSNGEVVVSINAHLKRIWSLALDPDSRLIATASADGSVSIWSTTMYKKLASWIFDVKPISLALRGNIDVLVVGFEDGSVRFLNIGIENEFEPGSVANFYSQ